jgi:hypothetical protein
MSIKFLRQKFYSKKTSLFELFLAKIVFISLFASYTNKVTSVLSGLNSKSLSLAIAI